MPKAKLVTRSETASTVLDETLNKASALTHAEMDSNLINLRDASWGLADDTSTVLQVTADKTIAIRGTQGISTALSGDTLTISGSSANIFKTIAVAGQSNIEADANTDTLTIAAGTNITLTTNATTDTLTISGPSLTSYITASSTDTLTNKTFDTAGTGNVFKINGTTISANTGTGSNVLATSPTLTTPVISSIVNTGTLTLPTSTDTLVGKATTDTLTNKTINLTSNTLSGTTAQFNTALSDGDFATLAGSETLTNKTLTTPIISSISNTGTLTLPTSTDTLVGKATTDTLTNKTINLTSNTLSGTTAQFNTALSDGDFATLAGSETLTNKTLTTPIISSISNTGTLTLPTSTDTLVGRATSDTLTNKTLTSPVISQIVSVSNGNITLEPNGTGKTIMGPAMTSTNFPYTIQNSSNTIPQWDSASYKANQMFYSNLSVADITAFDSATRANSRTLYGKADSSTTTYNNVTFRFQNTDNTIFDLNGATAGSTLTGNRGAGIRSIGAATVLTNSGGGTKTSPNLMSVTGFIQVDEGHAGTLTVANAMGMRSSLSVRGNSTETTTITNGYGYVADTSGGGGGAGAVAGTNYKITNMYGFADMPTSTASIETTHYGFYMNAGAGAGTKYFLYSADDTYLSRIGTVERYNEKINSLTSSSTITVDADLAPVHKVTLGVNTQFGIANLSTGQTVTIIIVQDATGSRTASFTSDTSTAVKFAGGTPTLSTAANSIDIVTIFNDGTNYYGNIAKAYA